MNVKELMMFSAVYNLGAVLALYFKAPDPLFWVLIGAGVVSHVGSVICATIEKVGRGEE